MNPEKEVWGSPQTELSPEGLVSLVAHFSWLWQAAGGRKGTGTTLEKGLPFHLSPGSGLPGLGMPGKG